MTNDVKTHGVLTGQTWRTAGGCLVYVMATGPVAAEVERARDQLIYSVLREDGRYLLPVDLDYKERVAILPLETYVRGPSLQNHTAEPTEEEDEAWKELEARMDVVGQNGNDGDHYPHLSCQAVQHSDQMVCECGNVWDVNDPQEPACEVTASKPPPLPYFTAYGGDVRQDMEDAARRTREAIQAPDGSTYSTALFGAQAADALRGLEREYEEKLENAGQGIAGGMKWDKDKPRMDLLLTGVPRALEAVGQVLTFGAEKYAAHSWQKVENAKDRYYAAQIRHQVAAGKGESYDPETGLLHLAHEACNALFRLELELQGQPREGDR